MASLNLLNWRQPGWRRQLWSHRYSAGLYLAFLIAVSAGLIYSYQTRLTMLSLRIDANAQQLAFLPKLEQRFLQRQQQSQQAKQRQTAKRQQDSLVTQFIELSQLSVTGLVISQINWLADELTISGLYQNTEAVKHLVDWLRRQQSNRQIDVSFPRAGQFLLLASDDRE